MWELALVLYILPGDTSIDQSVWIEFIEMLDQVLGSHALSVGHLVGSVDQCFDIFDSVFIESILSISAFIQAICLFHELLQGWCSSLM